MSLHERIKEARQKRGLTQEQLGTLIGVAKTTITGYEKNREPTAAKVGEIADALGVDVNFLFQDEVKAIHENRATPEELERLIKPYRTLDPHGKDIVDTILEKEAQRAKDLKEPGIITLAEYETYREPTYLIPYIEGGVSAGNGIYQLDDTSSIMMTLWANELTKQADFIIKVSGSSMEPKFHDGDKVLVNRKKAVEIGEIGIFIKNGDAYIKKAGNRELISLNPDYENIPIHEFDNVVCMGKVIGILTDSMIARD